MLLILFIVFGFPYLAIRLDRLVSWSFLSPIVLCFAIGILLRNLNIIAVEDEICGKIRDGTILFALPLLLLSSNVNRWVKHSKNLIMAFLLAASSACIAAMGNSILFANLIESVWLPAGMLTGIHTGGTPNLFSVGIAMNASSDVITLTNSAQILWGACYLLFLLSLGRTIFAKVLSAPSTEIHSEAYLFNDPAAENNAKNYFYVLVALLVVVFIIGASVGFSYLIFGSIEATFVIICVTTLSIACSFNERIRDLPYTFKIGDYLLLAFGVAVGLMSDFSELITEGGPYILFVFAMITATILIHVLLSKLFRIDYTSMMIASAAGIFGPVFIPQVCRVLDNKSLIPGGIAISLLGLGVGNYLGILMSYTCKYLVQYFN